MIRIQSLANDEGNDEGTVSEKNSLSYGEIGYYHLHLATEEENDEGTVSTKKIVCHTVK